MSIAQPISRPLRQRIISPLRDFINDSRSTGVLLIGCTIVSLIISNSGGTWYTHGWKTELLHSPTTHLPGSPLEWINNFLMAFFFLLAGLEIKRQLLNGELSTFKKAILPFGAAFGGMLVPALIYTCFNYNTPHAHGWGIPTATDIAFSVGIASLLGKRFSVGAKILLMALAIIDDLGAIIVVALFYGGHISFLWLGIAGLLYALLLLCQRRKLAFGATQIILGFALWYAMLQSGVEASITGVLFAFALPLNHLDIVEKFIHKPVNFFILPLFALANTAILVPDNILGALGTSVSMGVLFGLVVGKPIGIFLVSRFMVATKIAHLPSNTSWKQIFGMGTLAGIGFTMSIFTTMLAFSEERFRDIAKISTLLAVVASVVVSFIYFRVASGKFANLPQVIPTPQPESQTQPDLGLTAA